MLRFSAASASHVGRVRTNNEDSGFAGPYLIAVADGVGGAAAGEVASASTTYVTSAMSMISRTADPLSVLGAAVHRSHEHLRDGVLAEPSRDGMATTLTAVLSDGERFGLAHIGDSRGYLARDGSLIAITHDHTLVQTLVDEGQITAREVREHPYRSVVLRSIDGQHSPEPDLVWLDLREGDRLLLCSDGLTDMVPEEEIQVLLSAPSVGTAVSQLVEAALEAGGRDNITCIASDVVTSDLLCPDGALLGAVRDLDNLVDAAAVRMTRPA